MNVTPRSSVSSFVTIQLPENSIVSETTNMTTTDSSDINMTVEAERLERAIRSARISEAMNYDNFANNAQIAQSNNSSEASTFKNVMYVIALSCAVLCPTSIIVPFLIGPIGFIAPAALATVFVISAVLSKGVSNQLHNNRNIGP